MSRYNRHLSLVIILLSSPGICAQSIEPTTMPSAQPTSFVTADYPSVAPTTSPSLTPTVITTNSPTRSPQQRRPTLQPTRAPTLVLQGPIVKSVQIQLNGIDSLSPDEIILFENQTKAYIESFYLGAGKNLLRMFRTQVHVTRTDRSPYSSTSSTSKGGRRLANGPSSIVVTYDQTLLYRPFSSKITVNDTLISPFMNIVLRNNYTWYLQRSERSVFMNIKSVELPIICDNKCIPTSSNNLPLIIGASAGGGSALVIIIVIWFICFRRKAREKDGRSRPLLTRHKEEKYSPNNLEHPVRSVITNGEESVVSVDYDYSRAYYIEGNEQSVSSAGGTLGSATRRSKISGIDSKGVSGGGTTLSTDEASFEVRFRKQIVREETLIVIAPPGKLGVVIDSPEVGGPVVHAIKEGSVLANKLRVGDRLVAVDEDDVRTMSAIKVSKLISRKGFNAERKLTIVRSIQTTK